MSAPGPIRALSHRPMVGRADNLTELISSISSPGIVVVSGPAGVGKSRLCAEAAKLESPRRKVIWIDVQGLGSEWLRKVARLVLKSFAIDLPDSSLSTLIAAALAEERSPLIVLDNFDQLLEAEAMLTEVADLLDESTLLVTSRVALGSQPRLRSLRLVPMLEEDTTAQFKQRLGQDLDPKLAASLYQITQGLPLANEAAADAIEILGPTEGLRLLEHGRNTSIEALSQVIGTSLGLVQPQDVMVLVIAAIHPGLEPPSIASEFSVDVHEVRSSVARLSRLSLIHMNFPGQFELFPFVGKAVLARYREVVSLCLTRRISKLNTELARTQNEPADAYFKRVDQNDSVLENTLRIALDCLDRGTPELEGVFRIFADLIYQRKPSPGQLELSRAFTKKFPGSVKLATAHLELLRQAMKHEEMTALVSQINFAGDAESSARASLAAANACTNLQRFSEAVAFIQSAEQSLDSLPNGLPGLDQLQARLIYAKAHYAYVNNQIENAMALATRAFELALFCRAPMEILLATSAQMICALANDMPNVAIESAASISRIFREDRGVFNANALVHAYICAGQHDAAFNLASELRKRILERPHVVGAADTHVSYFLTCIVTGDLGALAGTFDKEVARHQNEPSLHVSFEARCGMALAAYALDRSDATELLELAIRHRVPGNKFLEEVADAIISLVAFTIGASASPPKRAPKNYEMAALKPVCAFLQARPRLSVEAKTWTVSVDGIAIKLHNKPTLWSLISTLAHARREAPGKPIDSIELFTAAWGGIRATQKSADERVRASVRNLRTLGLREHILSGDGGYFLSTKIGLTIS